MEYCKDHGLTTLPAACPICLQNAIEDRDLWRERWRMESKNYDDLLGLLREAQAFLGRAPASMRETIDVYVPLCNRIDAKLGNNNPPLKLKRKRKMLADDLPGSY